MARDSVAHNAGAVPIAIVHGIRKLISSCSQYLYHAHHHSYHHCNIVPRLITNLPFLPLPLAAPRLVTSLSPQARLELLLPLPRPCLLNLLLPSGPIEVFLLLPRSSDPLVGIRTSTSLRDPAVEGPSSAARRVKDLRARGLRPLRRALLWSPPWWNRVGVGRRVGSGAVRLFVLLCGTDSLSVGRVGARTLGAATVARV